MPHAELQLRNEKSMAWGVESGVGIDDDFESDTQA